MRIVVACATRRGLRFAERLAALASGHELVVCTFPEEPGEPPFLEDIRTMAHATGAEFVETRRLDGPRMAPVWERGDVDVMFLVSWRYLVPRATYERPRLGTYVFHDSLLPAYRGFAPTVWAIINGETETGVSLFRIADAVDSGPIIDQERVPIAPHATIKHVMEDVTETYLRVLDRSFVAIVQGTAVARPQDESRATFTCRRTAADGEIDWGKPTSTIYNAIRALTAPYPGAFSYYCGQRLTIWSATIPERLQPYVGRICGRVVRILPDEGVVVLTGDGEIVIRDVQLGDGPVVTADRVITSLSDTLGR